MSEKVYCSDCKRYSNFPSNNGKNCIMKILPDYYQEAGEYIYDGIKNSVKNEHNDCKDFIFKIAPKQTLTEG